MRKNVLTGRSGDAIMLVVIKFVTMALGMVTTRLLSQYLSLYDYGTYSQILLIVSAVSSVTVLGMVDGVTYFYCSVGDEKRREALVSTIFALQGIVSAVAGLAVMLLTRPLCLYLDNPDIRKLMIFAVMLPFFQNVLHMFQNLLVAVGKARLLAWRNLAVSLLRLGISLPVLLLTSDVTLILTTTLLLDAGQLIFFLCMLKGTDCRIRLRSVKPTLVRGILNYCLPMAMFIIIRAVNRDVDKYMISLLTDPETLAIYANASKMLPFDILMHSFYTVLVPEITRRVASRENEKAVSLYRDFLELGYGTMVILSFAALSAAPQLMRLLYSEKYLSGVPVFCIYILVDMLQFTNITIILSAAGKARVLMWLAAGMMLVNGILNVALYRWIGLCGPALATLVVTLLMGILMLKLGARELQSGVSGFFHGKFFCFFAAENLLLLLGLSYAGKVLERAGIHYVLILGLCAALYCGISVGLYGKRMVRLLKKLNQTNG